MIGSLNSIMWYMSLCIGKGVPNQRIKTKNLINSVNTTFIFTSEVAVQEYHTLGDTLTLSSPFRIDPLSYDNVLMDKRLKHMRANIPNYATTCIFHELVNGNDTHFHNRL